MAEDRETQFPCPGCKVNTLGLTLGVSSCAFQELRRRVVPFGRSRAKGNLNHERCQQTVSCLTLLSPHVALSYHLLKHFIDSNLPRPCN